MTEFRVFLSYTSREEEVKQLQPLINLYCRDLWEWARSNGIEIFYDGFMMEKRPYTELELETILKDAVNGSNLMTAFLSPLYIESKWCRLEYLESREKAKPVHAVFWKRFMLDMSPFSPLAQYLEPEGFTDVTYLRENPTAQEFERAAKECVENSIELIRQHYQI